MKTFFNGILAPLALLAVGCETELPLTDPYELVSQPGVVVIDNAVWMTSEAGGGLVKVMPGTSSGEAYTDLEGSSAAFVPLGETLVNLKAAPDLAHIAVIVRAWNGDQQLAMVDPAACDPSTDPAPCVSLLPSRPQHDGLIISPDSRWALTWITGQGLDQSDVVNLSEVAIYNLESGEDPRFATLGFAPSTFKFSQDGDRVVVLTDGQVVVMDLTTGVTHSRELTLSSETQVRPQFLGLTGDDHFALITLSDSADLYTIDLTQDSLPINILNLARPCTAFATTNDGAASIYMSDTQDAFDVLDHQTMSLRHVELDHFASKIYVPQVGNYVLLYDTWYGQPYLHRYDLARQKLQTWLLDGPISGVDVSPDGGTAVLYYEPYSTGSWWTVGILGLATNERQATPIQMGAEPRGVTFLHQEGGEDQAIFSLNGDGGRLAVVGLSSYSAWGVDIPFNAGAIYQLPSDGRLVVVHNSPAGFLTVAPATDPSAVQFYSGFMKTGMF